MSDLVRGLPIRESNEGVKTECSTSNLKKGKQTRQHADLSEREIRMFLSRANGVGEGRGVYIGLILTETVV